MSIARFNTRSSAFAAIVCVVLALGGPRASAETVLIGGGIQRDVQRFSGDPDLNRLDSAATGWTLLGGVTLLSHLAVRVEGSRGGRIDDARVISIDVDGRSVTIRSDLVHDTRSIAALAGYTHALSAHVRLAYLAGVSFTHVRRTFGTNAPGLILVSPSNPTAVAHTAPASSDPVTTTLVDDFPAFVAGADAIVLLTRHIGIVAGVRMQPLKLTSDLSGFSIRPLVGAAWTF